jgi:hypothetical protein
MNLENAGHPRIACDFEVELLSSIVLAVAKANVE